MVDMKQSKNSHVAKMLIFTIDHAFIWIVIDLADSHAELLVYATLGSDVLLF